MENRSRALVLLSSFAGLALGAVAFSLPSSQAAVNPSPQPLNLVAAKSLYGDRCSACHNLPDPVEKAMTRAEWQGTVNRMLTKYKASDTITAPEAATIVDYLATFAPKPGANNTRGPKDPWATDTTDVWSTEPSNTHVFNFESATPLSGLLPMVSGLAGPAPLWRVVKASALPDGNFLRVSQSNPSSDRFGLIVDQSDSPHNVDIKLRFQIQGGKASPAVGIVFGFVNSKNYSVLRYSQLTDDLAVIKISDTAHTTLQKTAVTLPLTDTTLASNVTVPAVPSALVRPSDPNAWHTLRLLVKDGQIRGWIDMNKRINTQDTTYTGGKVGLWAQGDTLAAFDDWTVDQYDLPAGAAPSPNI